ncbi:hypothetical protein Tco_0721687, partial [Tanacetum coccineum]
IETSLPRQYQVFKLSSKLFANIKLNFKGQPMQLLAAMLPQDQEGEGHTSGGAEDLITLTDVSSVVSTLVQKVISLETELKDSKKLFKDVVGKLVKKVKAMEVKLKIKKKKVAVSDSDQEKGGEQDVDLDALHALANAAVIVDSNIPPGGASNNPAASSHISTDVPTGGAFAPAHSTSPSRDPFKRKGVAKLFIFIGHVNDLRFLIKRKKQALAEKLAKERMERPMTPVQQRTYMRQFVKNQSSALYSTGWTKAKVESFTDAQLKEEFEKIQKALANTQVQAFSRTLKRTGPELEEPSSKQQKSTEAPIPSVPDVPQPPVVSSPKSSGTRRKSLGRNRLTKPKSILKELDLDADDKTFIKVLMDSQKGGKDHQSLWQIRSWRLYTLSNVHVLETISGEVLLHFAEYLPLSVKLMERMLKHKLEIDKDVVGNDMTTAEQLIRVFNSPMLHLLRVEMVINSPWIMPLLGTKGLASPEQTATGVLMKNKDAASSRDIQLICAEFSSIQVKTQADWMLLQSSYFNPQVSTSRYVVPTGRVVVPTGRYVVPAGKVIIIVSPGRLSLVPTGRVLSPGRVK